MKTDYRDLPRLPCPLVSLRIGTLHLSVGRQGLSWWRIIEGIIGKRIPSVPLNRLQKWQGGSRDPQRHRHGRLMRPQTRSDRQKTSWGPDVEAKDRECLLGVNFLILAAPIRLEFLATTRAIVVACYTTVRHREQPGPKAFIHKMNTRTLSAWKLPF